MDTDMAQLERNNNKCYVSAYIYIYIYIRQSLNIKKLSKC